MQDELFKKIPILRKKFLKRTRILVLCGFTFSHLILLKKSLLFSMLYKNEFKYLTSVPKCLADFDDLLHVFNIVIAMLLN